MANELTIARARAMRKAMTPQELRLWLRLRELRADGVHFRKQAPFRTYILDFVCHDRRLVVEVDGDQHLGDRQADHDLVRDNILKRQGYSVLRVTNAEANLNMDGVIARILAALEKAASRRDVRALRRRESSFQG